MFSTPNRFPPSGQAADKLKHQLRSLSVDLVGPVLAQVTHPLSTITLIIRPRQAAGHECQSESLILFFPVEESPKNSVKYLLKPFLLSEVLLMHGKDVISGPRKVVCCN